MAVADSLVSAPDIQVNGGVVVEEDPRIALEKSALCASVERVGNLLLE
jgi:hypothetical protein